MYSLQCAFGYSKKRYIDESPTMLLIKDFDENFSVISSTIFGAVVTSLVREVQQLKINKDRNNHARNPLALVSQ